MKDIKFDFNDILIKPVITTEISSRTEINPFDENGYLPLITAPMDTVIDNNNANEFRENKINICLPRGLKRDKINSFKSYSLKQFNKWYLGNDIANETNISYCLIDMANGHMIDLISSVEKAKNIYGENMVLMVGNIANPETYKLLSNAGADYIRVGIGNGNGCLTTQQLGIGYPMASLIKECYDISSTLDNPAKIVADGGMKDYSDIIKALALGADYVMIGSIFSRAFESCGTFYEDPNGLSEITKKQAIILNDNGRDVYKNFRGMSTKEVQKSWGSTELKTSEGVSRIVKVEYTINSWAHNFESYLRSAMSYTNSLNLKQFCGEVEIIHITNNALNRFKK